MRYAKVFLSWIVLSLFIGAILYYTSTGQNKHVIFILTSGIGIFAGFVNVLVMYSFASRKSGIFKEAIEIYNGKMNLYGKPEFTIKGRKIILDYDTGNGYLQTIEYIITKVDLTDLDKWLLETCKKNFDTIVVNNKIYAIFYSSWGYKGKKYKERIERKIDELNKCIEKNTFVNDAYYPV